jgi:hypothetical protein
VARDIDPLYSDEIAEVLASAVKACNGHWDKDLNWHQGAIWPEDAILSDILQKVKKN